MNISLYCQTQIDEFTAFCYPENQKKSRVGYVGLGVLAFVSHAFGSISDIGEGLYISCVNFNNKNVVKFCSEEKDLDMLFSNSYKFFLKAINPNISDNSFDFLSKEENRPVKPGDLIVFSFQFFGDVVNECLSSDNLFTKHVLGRAGVVASFIVQLFCTVMDVLIGAVCATASLLTMGYFSNINNQAYVQLSATREIKILLIQFGAFLHARL